MMEPIIGKYTYIGSHFNIRGFFDNENIKVQIGSFCSIADRLTLFIGQEHDTSFVSTYSFTAKLGTKQKSPRMHSKGSIIIGNDVWIGSNVTIMSGVTVGDGVVLGANALVANDIEPYSVVTGNPGIVRKKRFTDPQIEKLLKIAWWEWDIDKIKKNVNYLSCRDIDLMISHHG